MTFRQIEFFVAVTESRSINKASEQLNVSQQAVSKSLRSLEDELGCELLNRTNGGVSLTSYGMYVLEEFKSILNKRDYMVDHLTKMINDPQEPLQVGMSYGMLGVLPPHFLSTFSSEHPTVRLFYSDYPDRIVIEKLRDGTIDVAVIAGPVGENDDLQTEVISREPVYLLIPKEHPLYEKEHIYMEDISKYSFLQMSEQFHCCLQFYASCHHAGFHPHVELASDDFNSLKEQFVKYGKLFTCPEHTLAGDNREDFRAVRFPDPYAVWEVVFATKKTKLLTEPIKEFHRHLKNYIDPLPASKLGA